MRILTAGESHGSKLTTIIEGVPANLEITPQEINYELARRQGGFGRGQRMQIENDQVNITSGVRFGLTTGAPLAMEVQNYDYQPLNTSINVEKGTKQQQLSANVTKPRPGHADLVGALKYNQRDLRNISERASARETTMQVAIGAIAKKILQKLGILVASHVVNFGGIKIEVPDNLNAHSIWEKSNLNDVHITDQSKVSAIHELIIKTKATGDTLGGVIEIVIDGVFAGLGSFVQMDRKLDGKLAASLLSINAFKGVEFGLGFQAANLPGSKVMDEIIYKEDLGYSRRTNHLGGFEGGMTNGMPIIMRVVMKPIPTLANPLLSIDLLTKKEVVANVERSDITALPAAAVVAEAVCAYTLANEITKQFTSDSMEKLQKAVKLHKKNC